MIFSKWLVDDELAKNSSLHFELISTIVASRDCEISMKMLIKIEILAFRNFFYWSIGFMFERPNLIYIFYNFQMGSPNDFRIA